MADNKRVYELLNRLYKLCPKCKEQKIDIFFELIDLNLSLILQDIDLEMIRCK